MAGHFPHAFVAQAPYLLTATAAAMVLHKLETLTCILSGSTWDALLCDARDFLASTVALDFSNGRLLLAGLIAAVLLVRLLLHTFRKNPVYVVDFSVFKPDPR